VKSVLLVQLPHPSHEDRNIPLAAGFLKAAAFHAGLQREFDVDILDARQAAAAGCARIIRDIVERAPDIVGTSIYLWNAERNSYIFGEVKKRLSKLQVVVGGPEVTKDAHYILDDRSYDFFVFGEGEHTWVRLLQHICSGNPRFDEIPGMAFRDGPDVVVHPLHGPIVDVNQVPSPYLEHILDPADFGEMLLFTMRGCLQGCSYCSWSARGKLRAFSPQRLHKELLVARAAADKLGRRIIVSVADSAFNTSPAFWDFCHSAKEINRDGSLDIRCFLQAEMVDDRVAKALKDAGVATAEIGLQSSNPDVLANINRRDSIERFLDGVQVLGEWGFPIVVDTILGLPGDTRDTFEDTLRFVHNHHLRPLVFNLSLGHGSKLRGKAAEFGIRSDDHPPYYVSETNSMPQAEIREIMRENRDILADSDQLADLQFPVAAGSMSQIPSTFPGLRRTGRSAFTAITHLVVPAGGLGGSARRPEVLESLVDNLAANVTVLVLLDGLREALDLAWLETLLLRGAKRNPFGNWTLFFEGGDAVTRQTAVEFLLDRIPLCNSFLRHRDFLYPDDVPRVRNRNVSVYSIDPLGDSSLLPPAHCLSYADLNPMPDSTVLAALEDSRGAGLLLGTLFPLKGDDAIRDFLSRLEPLRASGKTLYFKDWVLQRYWQQNYLKSSPRIILRHELVLDDAEPHHLELGEADLYLDAIIRCGLATATESGDAMHELIIDAAVQRILGRSAGT
jgi:radical SAM superfamily enzyme YgiQ (UPF0313 family)